MENTVKTPKTVNYTAEMTAAIVEAYVANPTKETVEALALTYSKGVKSIVAKLVREKVYVAKAKTTKNGDPVTSKNEVASAIGAVLLMNENDTSSLEKANKTALAIIWKAIANSVPATPENSPA